MARKKKPEAPALHQGNTAALVERPAPPLIAVVADVHAHNHARHGGPMVDGLNRRGRETISTLRRAVELAAREGCHLLFVAGDLVHVRRPDPALLAALQVALRPPGEEADMAVVVPGNHDMLDASSEGGNTACAPLQEVARLINEPTWVVVGGAADGNAWKAPLAVLCIPFDARRPMADHIEAVVPAMVKAQPKAHAYALVTHVGVFDEEGAAPWQLKAKDGMSSSRMLDLLVGYGFAAGFVGNYHNHRIWTTPPEKMGVKLVQVGTLCPASFSDPQEDVGLVALASFGPAGASVRMAEVGGPRFRTAFPGETWDRAPIGLQRDGFHYYVRVRDAQAPDPAAAKRAEEAGFTIVWDPDHRDAKPDNGAGAVRISHTPEEALRAACGALEPAELRDPVQALVDEAWRQGA